MAQDKIITDDAEKVEVDEIEKLIRKQYTWELNDVEKLYKGNESVDSDDEFERILFTERQGFLAWLSDRPQRLYGGESYTNFLSIIESYSSIHKLWKLLRSFYEGEEYKNLIEELEEHKDRATEIPLIMIVDKQNDERAVHGEIRRVWFFKLNKEKSVIILVIDRSKLLLENDS